MSGFDIQDALKLLALGEGQNVLWSIMLYLIFILGLITLFLIPDKNIVPTLMMATLLLLVIVVKVSLASPRPIIARTAFGMLLVNIAMGAIPFIVAGTVRARHGKNKVTAPAILTGLFGFLYFFIFWLVVQRGA